jgi:argininosuccinate lyase
MAKKLWQKNLSTNAWVEDFTVGEDNIFDVQLAPYDILGNIAHCKMLAKIGLLQQKEADQLLQVLKVLYKEVIKDDADFKIQDGVEDIHSQIEFLLTEQLGDIGEKNTCCKKQK